MMFSLRVVRLDKGRVFRDARGRYGVGTGSTIQVIAATLRQREVCED